MVVAHARQVQRFIGTKFTCNADIGLTQERDFCQIDESARQLLDTVMRHMNLSARAYHRILKLARAIADLDGEERIGMNDAG
jgi:magnesium chelatase family protein